MHRYQINVILFFVLLTGAHIQTSEHILEIAKQLQESRWIDFNETSTIDTSFKEVISSTKESLKNKSFSLEDSIDSLGENITYVATNYSLHILVGCFISKQIYNYYKIFKEEIENERKDRLRQKIEYFLVHELRYEDDMKVLNGAYEKFIRSIERKMKEFPIDQIPADIKEAMEKLRHEEEIYPTSSSLITEEMKNNTKYYMVPEKAGVLKWDEHLNLWLTMRKKVAPLAIKIWTKQNNEKID